MTGERLYRLYCQARHQFFYPEDEKSGDTTLAVLDNGADEPPVAWPYLKVCERRVWNDIAKGASK